MLFLNPSSRGQMSNNVTTILPWEVGFSVGGSSFVSSRNPNSGATYKSVNYWYANFNPGIGLFVVRNISPAFGLEFNWLNTRLTGRWNDKWPPHPLSVGHESPLTFNSGINQFDLMMTFNMNQIMLPGDEEDPWHIFVKTGIGITNIKDHKNFYPDGNYQCLGISLDAGISVSLSKRLKLLMGSEWRMVSTDNLDGVHLVYTDSGENNIIEYKGIYEIYNYAYVKVSYGFGHFGSKKSKTALNPEE